MKCQQPLFLIWHAAKNELFAPIVCRKKKIRENWHSARTEFLEGAN